MKQVESNLCVLPVLRLLKGESGVTLVLVLVMVAILGLSAGIAGSTLSSLTRRAREADLLWKGGQLRKAIGSYYEASPGQGAAKIFPSKLEYLLKDPRFLETKRHLRRPYLDPMTGSDWELIKDPGGRIKGVHSSLAVEPFKQANFSSENKDFEGRGLYSEWEFVYLPQKTNSAAGQVPAAGNPQPPQNTNPPSQNTNPPSQNNESPQG